MLVCTVNQLAALRICANLTDHCIGYEHCGQLSQFHTCILVSSASIVLHHPSMSKLSNPSGEDVKCASISGAGSAHAPRSHTHSVLGC